MLLASVDGVRADEAVVGVLLQQVSAPTGDAGNGEDGGVEVVGDAQHAVHGGAEEVDVGVEGAAAEPLAEVVPHLARKVEVAAIGGGAGKLLAELLEDDGAWVGGLVDAMANAHDALAAGQHGLDVRLDVGLVADGLKHLEDGAVGSAVEGPLERADGGGDGGVHVAHGGGGDNGREGGSVHLVLGVERHGDVEDTRRKLGGLFADEGPEEVGGVVEIVARGDDVEALALAVEGSDDGGHARGEARGRPLELFLGEVVGLGVESAEGGDADLEGAHGLGRADEFGDEGAVEVGEGAFDDQERLELIELLPGGKLQIPEEKGGLFEGGVLGQVVDVVAGVDELALLAIDAAELGGGDVDAFKATLDFGSRHGEPRSHGGMLRRGRAPRSVSVRRPILPTWQGAWRRVRSCGETLGDERSHSRGIHGRGALGLDVGGTVALGEHVVDGPLDGGGLVLEGEGVAQHEGHAEDHGNRVGDALPGDVGGGAVDGLVHADAGAVATAAAEAGGGKHAQGAGEDGGLVGEDVAKHVARDDDVEGSGVGDEVHGAGVDEQVIEFDVRLLHHGELPADDDELGIGGPVRVLGIFTDGQESWGTVGVAKDILRASVECIIDGLEWKLRGEHRH